MKVDGADRPATSTAIKPRGKAISYLRWSTPEQGLGDTERRQIEKAKAFADENNLEFVDPLRDRGVSAYTGANRSPDKALGQFLRAVEDGAIEKGTYFLVESIDRLSRQVARKAQRLVEEIVDAGIIVVTLSDGAIYTAEILDTDPLALFRLLLTAMRAHEESKIKSDRVGKAWNNKRAKARITGILLTHLVPGWIDVADGKFAIRPGCQEVLIEIFERTAAGIGADSIATEFNKRGVPTFGRRGRNGRVLKQANGWYGSYIKKIVDNRAVLGDFQPGSHPRGGKWEANGETIPGYFPRAITDEQWHRAHHSKGQRTTTGGRSDSFRSLFRGLTFCACGSGMSLDDKGRGSGAKLICSAAKRHVQNDDKTDVRCLNLRRYDYARLEITALFGLHARAGQLLSRANFHREAIGEDLDILESRIDELKREQARWLDGMQQAGGTAPQSVITRLAAIENEIDGLRQEVKAKRIAMEGAPDMGDTPEGLAELHDALQRHQTSEQRRELNARLRRLISRIEFEAHEAGGATVVVSFVAGDKAKWILPA